MKSVKFYDRFSIITIFLVILFIIYELIWILNPEVSASITSSLNFIIAIPIILLYASYHLMILNLSDKLVFQEFQFLTAGMTLAPVSYFGRIRKLLKKYHTENKNI
jgi:hypothetical protein